MRKILLMTLIVTLLMTFASAAVTNISILYGQNSTGGFVPLQVNSNGALKTDINMSRSTGLFPAVDNAFDIGSAALRWRSGYFMNMTIYNSLSIRGGSNFPLDVFDNQTSDTIPIARMSNQYQNVLDFNTFPILRISRLGNGSTYDSSVDFAVGRYANGGTNANTQLDFILSNGNTVVPDTTVMTLLANGNVSVFGNLTAPYYFGNGQYLTGILTGNPFNQILNTSSNVTFANITANNISANYYFGNGSNLNSLQVRLDEILNPTASKVFTFPIDKILTFRSNDNTPFDDFGIFNFEAIGAFTGALVHMHQHTGNPGVSTLLSIVAEDADVTGLNVTTSNSLSAFFNKNIIVGGKVGIGTSTPSATLNVYGNFSTNSSFVITNDGKVGIGTTNPTSTLQVVGSVNLSSANTTYYAPNASEPSAGTYHHKFVLNYFYGTINAGGSTQIDLSSYVPVGTKAIRSEVHMNAGAIVYVDFGKVNGTTEDRYLNYGSVYISDHVEFTIDSNRKVYVWNPSGYSTGATLYISMTGYYI